MSQRRTRESRLAAQRQTLTEQKDREIAQLEEQCRELEFHLKASQQVERSGGAAGDLLVPVVDAPPADEAARKGGRRKPKK
jgi:flagellar motility protein MotE (MotC chaperone)